jgi:hypothetical protein
LGGDEARAGAGQRRRRGGERGDELVRERVEVLRHEAVGRRVELHEHAQGRSANGQPPPRRAARLERRAARLERRAARLVGVGLEAPPRVEQGNGQLARNCRGRVALQLGLQPCGDLAELGSEHRGVGAGSRPVGGRVEPELHRARRNLDDDLAGRELGRRGRQG